MGLDGLDFGFLWVGVLDSNGVWVGWLDWRGGQWVVWLFLLWVCLVFGGFCFGFFFSFFFFLFLFGFLVLVGSGGVVDMVVA